jgi:uncharacterized UBP type Zn finger protein
MSKLDKEHPSWESLRGREAAAPKNRPGIPNRGNTCYISALLQCFFALPMPDNFDIKVGHTQDLLRLLNHPNIIVRQALAQMVKAGLSALGMDQEGQQDASDLLQYLIQATPQTGSTERNLLDVLRFQSFVQITNCHCGMEHEKKPVPKNMIHLLDRNCQCKRSCMCPVSVKNALDAMNTTEFLLDHQCDHTGLRGSAEHKFSVSLESTDSPELVFVAQGRVNKDCACTNKAKCPHKVTPSLTFIFPVAVL